MGSVCKSFLSSILNTKMVVFNLEGDASGTEGNRVIKKEVPLQSSTSVKDERHGIKKDSAPRIVKTQDRPK